MSRIPLSIPLLLLAGSLSAAVLDDFERTEPGLKGNGDKGIAPKVSLVNDPGGDGSNPGRCLRLDWPANHGAWMDVGYLAPRPTMEVVPGQVQSITLKAWYDSGCGIDRIGVRFVNAAGQWFQWTADLPAAGSPGWRTVTIPVVWDKPAYTWGGSATGVSEGPVRLVGFGFDCSAEKNIAGSLIIDDVSFQSAAH